MDEHRTPAPEPSTGQSPVDLTALEQIEAELAAVERALEQIDEGVYEGFAGLPGEPGSTS